MPALVWGCLAVLGFVRTEYSQRHAGGDDDEQDILATADALVGSSSKRLATGNINTTRMKDANQQVPRLARHA